MNIIFSLRVWHKIQCLTPQQRSIFLSKIRRITHKTQSAQQIKKITVEGKKTVFRIRYNLNYRIIATLTNRDQLKIVDFIPHDGLDRNTYYIDGIGEYTIEDIESLNEEELQDTINQQHLWQNTELSMNESDFSYQENDFCSYIINPQHQQDPDLILSKQQYQIINQKPNLPILLTGSAGSGKTSIAIYSALRHAHLYKKNQVNAKVLYITYNSSLTRYAQSIIERIYPEKLDSLINIDYYHFCKQISTEYQINIDKFIPENKINITRFIKEFYQTRISKINNLNPISFWQEIRHLLKGSIIPQETENNLISYEIYQARQSQSTLPSDIDREKVYQLFTQYQKWLNDHEYWDELDYTHYLLKEISQEYKGKYQQIYCDEIQDLTEIEIQLILKFLIVNSYGHSLPQFFLTGDPAQTINPSGFSWDKIKSLIWQNYWNLPQWEEIQAIIEPQQLTINFRSVNGIVNLGSAIVDLIQENLDKKTTLIHQETWLQSDHKPLILSSSPLPTFEDKKTFGTKNAIIVSDESEKEKLAPYFPLDSERILTIQEIKGLEFDEVLVWNFFDSFHSWTNRQNAQINELNRFKYNCLYVCITRARNRLFFYDETAVNFWQNESLKNLVSQGEVYTLETLFASYESEREMREAIEEYIKQGTTKSYKIALQILQRIGDQQGVNRVYALLNEGEEKWELAGDYWDKINSFDNAYRCWGEIDPNLWPKKWSSLSAEDCELRANYFWSKNEYDLAVNFYQKANNFKQEIECLLKMQSYELAGDKLLQKGRKKDAKKCYQLADEIYLPNGDFSISVGMWSKLEEWNRVASLWEKLSDWEKAGECWYKAGNWESSAICWQKVQNWQKAEECWQILGKWDEVAICCQYQNKWELAGENWLKSGQIYQSACCYQRANNLDKSLQLWTQLESWHNVAVILEQQEKWSQAAQIWVNVNPLEQKALCHEKSQDWGEAEICWRYLERWDKVAFCLEKQEKWRELAQLWQDLEQWKKSALAWLRVGETERGAVCYEKGGYWQEAEFCWRHLKKEEKVAFCLEKQQRWWQLAELWQDLEQWKKSAVAWLRVGETERGAVCYENCQEWQNAEICWQQLERWDRVAFCLEKQNRS
ncbi:MAG: AAA family ATPase [Cyanobacterium sp. T60_A2020_053]|nr:AAA family ATPase [Cyanobacterium sp. T60_A2020_053]